MENRLRVCVLTPGSFSIPSDRASSVEQVVYETGKRIARQAPDIDLIILGRKANRQAARETRHGVKFVRLSPYKNSGHYIAAAVKQLAALEPDIIQVENRPRFAKRIKQSFPGRPVLLSLHSTVFISPPHISQGKLAECLSFPDRIIVNSAYLKAYLTRLAPGVAEKCEVIHPGVDTRKFASKWAQGRKREIRRFAALHGLAGKKVVLYVGRLIPRKGVHHLLDAFPKILRRVPNAKLVLVGGAFYGSKRETPYVRSLRQKAKKSGGHVRFVPYVPHNRLDPWFRAADVVVVPSDKREAFGLVNVEAMASGVPVVATNGGGIAEVVADGETGILVATNRFVEHLADAVCRLLTDEALRRKMGQRGVDRAKEHFTWERTARSYRGLYARLR
ncbi:MAG TPA: glycosyltransferase family 4 protein [Bacilli bacterium]